MSKRYVYTVYDGGDVMPTLTLSELGQASRNAVLATKVSRVLQAMAAHRALNEQDRRILERGAELLGEIVQGSLVIRGAGPEHGLAPSVLGLEAFSHAMSAVRQIGEADADLTAVFLHLRERLLLLATGVEPVPDEIPKIQRFFRAIASLFQGDLAVTTLPPTEPALNR
jgi:hypothetical protein